MYEIYIKTKGIILQHPETGEHFRTPRKIIIEPSSLQQLELTFGLMLVNDYEVSDLGDEYIETRHIVHSSRVKRSENVNLSINGTIRGR